MHYRTLGRSGVQVSQLSLGTMMFGRGGNKDEDECVEMVQQALGAGINLFDSADGYGLGDAEAILGRALRGHRADALIATKCYFPRGREVNRRGGSRRWIRQACDESLRRLDTDYIDLYQLHRLDPQTDWSESLGALDELVAAGKVRMVGTSGATAHEQVELARLAQRHRLPRMTSEQLAYSIFTRRAETAELEACRRYGIGVIAYGPLNGGWLSGKYRAGDPPPETSRAARAFYNRSWWDRERLEVQHKLSSLEPLARIAADSGRSLPSLAVDFVLSHPSITSAIVGPRTLQQLTPFLIGERGPLAHDVLDAIDQLVAPGVDVDPTDMVTFDPALESNSRRPAPRR